MGDKSFTFLEPHMHGDVQIGPKTIGTPEADDVADDLDVEMGVGDGPSPVAALLVALVAAMVAIAIAKKVRGGDDA